MLKQMPKFYSKSQNAIKWDGAEEPTINFEFIHKTKELFLCLLDFIHCRTSNRGLLINKNILNYG